MLNRMLEDLNVMLLRTIVQYDLENTFINAIDEAGNSFIRMIKVVGKWVGIALSTVCGFVILAIVLKAVWDQLSTHQNNLAEHAKTVVILVLLTVFGGILVVACGFN